MTAKILKTLNTTNQFGEPVSFVLVTNATGYWDGNVRQNPETIETNDPHYNDDWENFVKLYPEFLAIELPEPFPYPQ